MSGATMYYSSQIIFKAWNLNRWKLLLSCMIFWCPPKITNAIFLGQKKMDDLWHLVKPFLLTLYDCVAAGSTSLKAGFNSQSKSDNKFAIRTHFGVQKWGHLSLNGIHTFLRTVTKFGNRSKCLIGKFTREAIWYLALKILQ